MDPIEIFKHIKESFCQLIDYKVRPGNVLEVITSFNTINSKFISIFIRLEKEKIVVTDGGWVDSNYYDNPLPEESEEVIQRIIWEYGKSYGVKSTKDASSVTYYYKICEGPAQIPSCVLDMAHFAVGAVNAYCISFKDEAEERERETFRTDANTFLNELYGDKVKFRQSLDDFRSIKFNAIISRKSRIFLISYITGSTSYYFENDLRKSIVNFEFADKSKYRNLISEKISIVNNQSQGYDGDRAGPLFELLREKTTRAPIRWTDKQTIIQYISPM